MSVIQQILEGKWEGCYICNKHKRRPRKIDHHHCFICNVPMTLDSKPTMFNAGIKGYMCHVCGDSWLETEGEGIRIIGAVAARGYDYLILYKKGIFSPIEVSNYIQAMLEQKLKEIVATAQHRFRKEIETYMKQTEESAKKWGWPMGKKTKTSE